MTNLQKLLAVATRPENDDYHASPGLSWSRFGTFINVSPLQFKHDQDNPRVETNPMRRGSLAHVFANEPHLFEKEYRVIPDCNLGTKAGKQDYVDALVNYGAIDPGQISDALAWKADQLREAMTKARYKVVTTQDVEDAKGAARAITLVNQRIPGDYNPDLVELAFQAEINGVLCRCKTDRIDGRPVIYDPKFTGKDLASWDRGMSYGDYLLGDAWYRMVIEAASGYRPPPIRYVGTEIKPPHDSLVRYYPDSLFIEAREVILKALDRYNECVESDVWPGRDGEEPEQEINVFPSVVSRIQHQAVGEMSDEYAENLLSQVE